MNKKLGYLAGIGVVILFGINPVITKYYFEVHNIDPLVTNFLRVLIGGILALIISKYLLYLKSKKGHTIERFKYNKRFFIALLGLITYYILSYSALRYTSATNVELINAFTPVGLIIISLFLSPIIIARFKNKARLIFIIVLFGSVGSSLILNIGSNSNSFGSIKTLGDGLAFIAMLGYALYSIKIAEYKKNKNLLSSQVQYRMLLMTAIVSLPLIFNMGFNAVLLMSPKDIIMFFIFLILTGGPSALLWMTAARNLNVLSFILLHNFTPLVTIGLEMYLLGFSPSWRILVGGLLIIGASISIEYLTSKQEELEKREKNLKKS